MADVIGMAAAWLVLYFGDDRQYAGNSGYADELSETYGYDSNVSNWKQVSVGDALLIRDRDRLLGVARVNAIESYPSSKDLQRCPVCRTTGIKARTRMTPRFRCNEGHEFERPTVDTVACTKLEAKFGSSFLAAVGEPLSTERLRTACPRYTDQLSIQRIDLAGLKADLMRTVPGYDALARQLESTTDHGGGDVAIRELRDSSRETAPPEGALGAPYRIAIEEATASSQRDPFVVDPAAVDRANRSHARTRNLLADHLRSLGLTPRSPAVTEPDYDLGWEVHADLFVAEVKSLTKENEEKQLGLGLGQVLRYRQQLARGGRAVTAVLMLERRPTDRTWGLLCDELGVILAWPENLGIRNLAAEQRNQLSGVQ